VQVTLCDPMWHMSSSSGVATSVSELLYPCYFTLFIKVSHMMKTSPFSVMDAPYPGDVYIPNRQRAA